VQIQKNVFPHKERVFFFPASANYRGDILSDTTAIARYTLQVNRQVHVRFAVDRWQARVRASPRTMSMSTSTWATLELRQNRYDWVKAFPGANCIL